MTDRRGGGACFVFLAVAGAANAAAGPPPCTAGGGSGPVQAPVFVRNLDGQTGWYASPLIADLDGDGQLEVLGQTFDHGLDVFTVPGSGTGCLLWPTARGGPLRMGQPNGAWMLTETFADGFESGATPRWSAVVP